MRNKWRDSGVQHNGSDMGVSMYGEQHKDTIISIFSQAWYSCYACIAEGAYSRMTSFVLTSYIGNGKESSILEILHY